MKAAARMVATIAAWWVIAGSAFGRTSPTTVAVAVVGGFVMAEFIAVAVEVLDELLPDNNQEAQ